MKKRILITGGAGFIGSHLCGSLLENGHEVICLDNFFTGSTANIVPFMHNPYFSVLRHDVSVPISLEVDQIYNLACPASPVHYQFDPVQTTKTSVMGAINMLDIAKRCGARILQASTSEVYGDPHEHPQKESYWGNVNPIGIRSCYDEGKRCAEALFYDYKRQHNVDIRVARIFNTYGPNMSINDGRVISNFIMAAISDRPLTVYGSGTQTRSLCFVSDMVRGLIALMESNYTDPINLGNSAELSISEIAIRVVSKCQSVSMIVTGPLPQDDPTQRCPDISLAMTELTWRPAVNFDDGLSTTIDYFQALKFGDTWEQQTNFATF